MTNLLKKKREKLLKIPKYFRKLPKLWRHKFKMFMLFVLYDLTSYLHRFFSICDKTFATKNLFPMPGYQASETRLDILVETVVRTRPRISSLFEGLDLSIERCLFYLVLHPSKLPMWASMHQTILWFFQNLLWRSVSLPPSSKTIKHQQKKLVDYVSWLWCFEMITNVRSQSPRHFDLISIFYAA